MTVYNEAVAKRKEVICNVLQEAMPLSRLKLTLIDEYSMELTDTTIRRDLKELKESGVIQVTGAMHNREPVYVAATGYTMPRLYDALTSLSWLPTELQEHYCNNGKAGLVSTMNIRVIEATYNELLNFARQKVEHPEYNYQVELDQLKANCTKSLSVILGYSKMIEQLLAQKVWWSDGSLANVTTDPSFDAQKVWDLHSKV